MLQATVDPFSVYINIHGDTCTLIQPQEPPPVSYRMGNHGGARSAVSAVPLAMHTSGVVDG